MLKGILQTCRWSNILLYARKTLISGFRICTYRLLPSDGQFDVIKQKRFNCSSHRHHHHFCIILFAFASDTAAYFLWAIEKRLNNAWKGSKNTIYHFLRQQSHRLWHGLLERRFNSTNYSSKVILSNSNFVLIDPGSF
jgi:hypothetical protein